MPDRTGDIEENETIWFRKGKIYSKLQPDPVRWRDAPKTTLRQSGHHARMFKWENGKMLLEQANASPSEFGAGDLQPPAGFNTPPANRFRSGDYFYFKAANIASRSLSDAKDHNTDPHYWWNRHTEGEVTVSRVGQPEVYFDLQDIPEPESELSRAPIRLRLTLPAASAEAVREIVGQFTDMGPLDPGWKEEREKTGSTVTIYANILAYEKSDLLEQVTQAAGSGVRVEEIPPVRWGFKIPIVGSQLERARSIIEEISGHPISPQEEDWSDPKFWILVATVPEDRKDELVGRVKAASGHGFEEREVNPGELPGDNQQADLVRVLFTKARIPENFLPAKVLVTKEEDRRGANPKFESAPKTYTQVCEICGEEFTATGSGAAGRTICYKPKCKWARQRLQKKRREEGGLTSALDNSLGPFGVAGESGDRLPKRPRPEGGGQRVW